MKQLWAPWRIEYILSKKTGECIFCEYPKKNDDRQSLLLYRGRLCYVMMNKYPYNGGHLMVVPFRHAWDLEGLGDDEINELVALTKRSIACISRVMRPEGFNTGLNIGKAAGAGIEEHLHMHIVPRWTGDSSFMAVLDEVRVVPEHLLATYDKLFPVFNE
ncbi:MAG: HIT domain-containing protein, partial [Nitrospiraceae bacterium]|nr:HIT domain-containing protein [Nitrospiraceae bacterium]